MPPPLNEQTTYGMSEANDVSCSCLGQFLQRLRIYARSFGRSFLILELKKTQTKRTGESTRLTKKAKPDNCKSSIILLYIHKAAAANKKGASR